MMVFFFAQILKPGRLAAAESLIVTIIRFKSDERDDWLGVLVVIVLILDTF
jgi:hypothetical protein